MAWGDTFQLDTSIEIGSGDLNTQQIVEGNLNDNSSNGFEYGNENILILTFVETYSCIEKSALLWSENAAKASYLIKNP